MKIDIHNLVSEATPDESIATGSDLSVDRIKARVRQGIVAQEKKRNKGALAFMCAAVSVMLITVTSIFIGYFATSPDFAASDSGNSSLSSVTSFFVAAPSNTSIFLSSSLEDSSLISSSDDSSSSDSDSSNCSSS